MTQPFKDAVSVCQAITRNGLDAYVISARIQKRLLDADGANRQADICTEAGFDDLRKIFPTLRDTKESGAFAELDEASVRCLFYPITDEEGSYVEESVVRLTPRLTRELEAAGELKEYEVSCLAPRQPDDNDGFADSNREGHIRLVGLPDETLKRNYLRAVRALRFSANFHQPLEASTRMAILRHSRRVLDYVPVSEIMGEWRRVEAENMAEFVRLLYESMILHGLIPEVAALARLKHVRKENEEESVFDHTLEVMRRYPEELPYDWYGVLACLFHDVGKLYTAEFLGDYWSFPQHHRVGAKITRKIMRRLGFLPQEIDLVSHLVRRHMSFHVMLTDKGIRRFKALNEYPRLIEMARADLKARGVAYKEFNHNQKMLERADIPEEVLEPLLNGNEIMEFTGLPPGPKIGVMREALRQAQAAGDVSSVPEAVEFVLRHRDREKL